MDDVLASFGGHGTVQADWGGAACLGFTLTILVYKATANAQRAGVDGNRTACGLLQDDRRKGPSVKVFLGRERFGMPTSCRDVGQRHTWSTGNQGAEILSSVSHTDAILRSPQGPCKQNKSSNVEQVSDCYNKGLSTNMRGCVQ